MNKKIILLSSLFLSIGLLTGCNKENNDDNKLKKDNAEITISSKDAGAIKDSEKYNLEKETMQEIEKINKRELSSADKKYVEDMANKIKPIADENNLYTSILLAQSILETNYGKSSLAKEDNNYFSIVKPVEKGEKINKIANYKHYDTVEDSIKDYIDILKENNGYIYLEKTSSKSPEDSIIRYYELYTGGNKEYGKIINAYIEKLDLKKYDE